MLNIRSKTVATVVVTLLFLGNHPPVLALKAPEVKKPKTVNLLVSLRGATELSQDELVGLLKAVGFEGKALKTAWAVAMKESNGRPKAHNDNVKTGDNSYGIFQINMLGSLGADRREKFNLTSNKDLFDPVTNAKVAYYMTNKGTDWSSWKVYAGQTNGERYEAFLKRFPQGE